MLRVSIGDDARNHDWGDLAQSLYDFSCVIEPSHMGVTGCKKPIRHSVDREFKPRHEELFESVLKLAIEKLCLADSG